MLKQNLIKMRNKMGRKTVAESYSSPYFVHVS